MSIAKNNLEERDDALNKQMAAHPAEESIEVLVKDAHRRQVQLRLLTTTVIVNLLMVFALAAVSYRLYQTTKLTQSTTAAVLANCETANDSRKNQLSLWNYVFSITPNDPRTPEQDRRNQEFREFVEETFRPRNCQAEINM